MTQTVELIRRWRSGDNLSGDRLFRRLYGELLCLANGLFPEPLRGREDAEDIVQTACAAACENLDHFEYRGPGTFRSWLFAILEHQVWNLWRRERAQVRDVRKDRPLPDNLVEPNGETPSEDFARQEDKEKIKAALKCLRPDYRRVVETRYFDNMTWDEISKAFGRSKEAMQMMLLRALDSLRKHLERKRPSGARVQPGDVLG